MAFSHPISLLTTALCNPLLSFRQRFRSNIQQQQRARFACSIRCAAGDQPAASLAKPSRRSANYSPSLWDDNYIQSLACEYTDHEMHGQRIHEKLKEDVRRSLLHKEDELVNKLELVDVIQQLGVAYHFEKEINDVLGSLFGSMNNIMMLVENDLYAASLLFRLLRGNRFFVSQDIFKSFKDEKGNFKASLVGDINGILSLYEASYFGMAGEPILDQAMEFTKKHLKKLLDGSLLMNPSLKEKLAYALELPLNWRINRPHARWFIDRYENNESMDPILLKFAKLDYNMVQCIYKRELKDLSRWWTDLGLVGGGELSFARDRLAESYSWTIGWCFEPKFYRCREAMTKTISLVSMIDDIYDVYGSLDELELFTDVVDRWDVNAINQLPNYMQLAFLGLLKTYNDVAYDILKEKGLQTIHCITRAWADLCKGFFLEAKWYHHGYMPTLQEYLGNAWITIGAHLALVLSYCMSEDITKEALDALEFYPDIVRHSAMVIRLCDDLATSKAELARGDSPKSIQCYMHEKRSVSEAEACKHVRELISAAWKELNRYRIASSADDQEPFRTLVLNIPRMSQCTYQHGDGFGKPGFETFDQIISLLIDPIPI